MSSRASVPSQHINEEFINELQTRIALLENELLDTKMELACVKSSEDTLKLQVATLQSELLLDHRSSGSSRSDAINSTSSYSTDNQKIVAAVVDHSQQKKKTTLNPGSCASAMNFLGLMDDDDASSTNNTTSSNNSNTPTAVLPTQQQCLTSRGSSCSISKVLKKASCASGINFLYSDLFADTEKTTPVATVVQPTAALLNQQPQQQCLTKRSSSISKVIKKASCATAMNMMYLFDTAPTDGDRHSRSRLSNNSQHHHPLSSVDIMRFGQQLITRISSVTLSSRRVNNATGSSRREHHVRASRGNANRNASVNADGNANNRNEEWGLLE